MSEIRNYNQSRPSGAGGSDYVWKYEYYDYDEPVSFEGLKVHRYSIVIGFWVGLAVFVLFMFFVLTLLTKTGAPHQENPELCEKRHRLGNGIVDVRCPRGGDSLGNEDKAFSRPLLDQSHSFFHFYISEEEQGRGSQGVGGGGGTGCHGGRPGARGRLGADSSFGLEEMVEIREAEERLEGSVDSQERPEGERSGRDNPFMSQHFDIPNLVNSEHGSIPREPPVFLEDQSSGQDTWRDVS